MMFLRPPLACTVAAFFLNLLVLSVTKGASPETSPTPHAEGVIHNFVDRKFGAGSFPQKPQPVEKMAKRESLVLSMRMQIELLKQLAKKDEKTRLQVEAILSRARVIADQPIVYRAASLQNLREWNSKMGKRSGGIDPRTKGFEADSGSPEKAEMFALAMSDSNTAGVLDEELPLLAAAYVLTGDQKFIDRIVAQLREAMTWIPLQRPGWTLPYASGYKLPPGGDDGVWLATGLGLAGLSHMLQILGPGVLPEDLENQVRQFMGREIERVHSDWVNKVPWYVQSGAVVSNQWVVPVSGLVLAASTLGPEHHREAYELGIQSLQQTLSVLGEEGAVSEGPGYAMHWTAPFIYQAARAAAEAEDTRLSSNPFLKKFPVWLAQSFQPGQSLVNCFDHTAATRGNYRAFAEDITRLAALSGDPALRWILHHEIKSPSKDFYGLLALAGAGAEAEPPLQGVFQRGCYVVWRDSWDDTASGVWIRGGDARDFHDHWDRGHVNFIAGGRTILMEAGTSWYGDPKQKDEFQSLKGHNVLQVGSDIFPPKAPAPLRVNRLSPEGGDVTVEAGKSYPQVRDWTRRAVWTPDTMEVTDQVALAEKQPLLFRWHLASEEPLDIRMVSATEAEISLPPGVLKSTKSPETLPSAGVKIRVASDHPIKCVQENDLDHSLFGNSYDHRHSTLVVLPVEPVSQITINTTFEADITPPPATGEE